MSEIANVVADGPGEIVDALIPRLSKKKLKVVNDPKAFPFKNCGFCNAKVFGNHFFNDECYLCRKCVETNFTHRDHGCSLSLYDVGTLYRELGYKNGKCDVCSRALEGFALHCDEHSFDLCNECIKPRISSLSPLSPYILCRGFSKDNKRRSCSHCTVGFGKVMYYRASARNRLLCESCFSLSKFNDVCADLPLSVQLGFDIPRSVELGISEPVVPLPDDLGIGTVRSSDDSYQVCNNGLFVWRIRNYHHLFSRCKKGEKKYIESNPFYSADVGYRLRARIYPYGDGKGRGTHFSIFVAFLKGDFDPILKWPFVGKVRISLVDQLLHDDFSNSFVSDGDPDVKGSGSFVRPEGENVGTGFPRFMPITDLSKGYLSEDAIYIKVQVYPRD